MVDTQAPPPRIAPPVNDANRAFWTGGEHGELLVQRCDACGRWVLPPTDACPDCGGVLEARAVSGNGTVFTFTINRHQYHPDVDPPYVIAIVELAEQEGLRFMTNIVGCEPEDVSIDMPVRVVFEHHGDVWVPVFAPS